MLQFPYFIPFSLSILISTGGTPFLYLSFPSELSDTHAFLLLLALLDFLFDKHSLKAMHLFTIKTLPSRILVP